MTYREEAASNNFVASADHQSIAILHPDEIQSIMQYADIATLISMVRANRTMQINAVMNLVWKNRAPVRLLIKNLVPSTTPAFLRRIDLISKPDFTLRVTPYVTFAPDQLIRLSSARVTTLVVSAIAPSATGVPALAQLLCMPSIRSSVKHITLDGVDMTQHPEHFAFEVCTNLDKVVICNMTMSGGHHLSDLHNVLINIEAILGWSSVRSLELNHRLSNDELARFFSSAAIVPLASCLRSLVIKQFNTNADALISAVQFASLTHLRVFDNIRQKVGPVKPFMKALLTSLPSLTHLTLEFFFVEQTPAYMISLIDAIAEQLNNETFERLSIVIVFQVYKDDDEVSDDDVIPDDIKAEHKTRMEEYDAQLQSSSAVTAHALIVDVQLKEQWV